LLPGSTSGIFFINKDASKPIEISFYGIGEKLKRVIRYHGYSLNLINRFFSESTLPVLVETIQDAIFINTGLEVIRTSLNQNLEITTDKIQIHYDPFILKNYTL
jgi:hypothetical protein